MFKIFGKGTNKLKSNSRKKLEAEYSSGMPATIRFIIFRLPICYLKIKNSCTVILRVTPCVVARQAT
jgi:hypothetical protein